MWIQQPEERLPNGMPIKVFACSNCKNIWRYFDKADSRCLHCGQINDLILNEDGSLETTLPTEEELDEIEKLQKENEELKAQVSKLAIELIRNKFGGTDNR